jgi:hypothetical protein
VTIQSGKEYKEMVKYFKQKYHAGSGNINNGGDDAKSDESVDDDFRNNPYLYMFYTPRRDNLDEVHMPDCDDFVVYHFKKTRLLKAFRLFQCHCPRIKHVANRRRRSTSDRVTQRTREQIP